MLRKSVRAHQHDGVGKAPRDALTNDLDLLDGRSPTTVSFTIWFYRCASAFSTVCSESREAVADGSVRAADPAVGHAPDRGRVTAQDADAHLRQAANRVVLQK